ncbi:hypothetical protein PVK06_042558 [Gossypium arboreum]|uniref:Uncharacterized protein n=1 Tax=Gossypium arboreum TaxID=29729 RepID=A0ABR0ML22_GOSAR|nr:hypothetical protein PVK06_042558 [Gossypium arboreum]
MIFDIILLMVLDRHVSGSATDLETHSAYLGDRLVPGKECSIESFGPLNNAERLSGTMTGISSSANCAVTFARSLTYVSYRTGNQKYCPRLSVMVASGFAPIIATTYDMWDRTTTKNILRKMSET